MSNVTRRPCFDNLGKPDHLLLLCPTGSLLVHITIDCKPLPFAGSIPSLHPQRPLDPNQPPLYNAHPLPGAILTSSVFVFY